MRQILFRAKTLNEDKWAYGDLLQIGGGCLIYFGSKTETLTPNIPNTSDVAVELMMNEVCPVDPDTLGQYTGVDDKNGKWIFEGDIVYWRNRNYVVKFWNGMFYASVEECNKDICGGFPLHALTTTAEKDDKCAVVGNVFDNPLLLE